MIVYLLEDGTLDPWFIGTDKCEVLTQEVVTQKRAKKKGRRTNQKCSKLLQEVPVCVFLCLFSSRRIKMGETKGKLSQIINVARIAKLLYPNCNFKWICQVGWSSYPDCNVRWV